MSARTAGILCVLLTLLALGVRLAGIGFGVPIWEEPDPDIACHVDLVRDGWTVGAVEHPDEQYPHLIADVARWLPARPDPTSAAGPRTLEQHLDAAAWTYVQVRELVALMALLGVPLTFLLARRFVRPGWALLSAALVATSLLHQSFSQQARPHAAAATLFVLALIADLWLVRRGTWRAYLGAGVVTALAIGSLHSAVALALPGLAAHVLRRSGGRRLFDARLLVAVALCLVAIPLFYPFLFGHVAQPREVGGGAVRFAEHELSFSQFYGRGFRVVAQSMWNYEPLLSLLVVVALVTWLVTPRRSDADRRELWVVLAFALPYLVVIGLFERTYERFLLPLIPCFAIFAAWGVQRLAERWSVRLVASFVTLALIVPAAATVKLAALRASPDTLDEVAGWVREHDASSAEPIYLSAVAPALDLPLFRKPEGLLFHGKPPKLPLSPWTAWQARVPEDRAPQPRYDLRWLTLPRASGAPVDLGAHLQSLAPALFVIEVYEERTNHPLMMRLRQELAARGERLARFSPDADPEANELELFYQLSDHFNDDEDVTWPHFTTRLLRARAIGPVLEVWRVSERR